MNKDLYACILYRENVLFFVSECNRMCLAVGLYPDPLGGGVTTYRRGIHDLRMYHLTYVAPVQRRSGSRTHKNNYDNVLSPASCSA